MCVSDVHLRWREGQRNTPGRQELHSPAKLSASSAWRQMEPLWRGPAHDAPGNYINITYTTKLTPTRCKFCMRVWVCLFCTSSCMPHSNSMVTQASMGNAISLPLIFRCSSRDLPNDGFSTHASAAQSKTQMWDNASCKYPMFTKKNFEKINSKNVNNVCKLI